MSSLNVKVPHQLSQEEALTRIKSMLTKLQQEQKGTIDNVSEKWEGNNGEFSFSAKGFNLSGEIRVGPSEVAIDGDLPFMLSFFKGKITDVIKEKATEVLSAK